MIIDTHLHLIDKSALSYPWLGGVPALDRDFLYSAYAAEAKRVGIAASLHMEVDVEAGQIERETSEIARLSRELGSLLRGAIAACRPEDDGFAAYLERQEANAFIRGFRRVLHVVADDLSEQPLFRENIRRLSGTRFTFDLCVLPHQIPKAMALADLAPDVRFVLDHCGVPDIKGRAEHPWREHMTEIARRPNVTAKISGVIAYAEEDWTLASIRPYVEHTIAAFGWDRIVWGSDWPVCTLGGNLSTWVAATHALIEGCSLDERTKLLSGNARRIWNLA
ncbi:amidohydrolase family protein [Sinorhizobium medicae]|nr:amidohydrolase family protein [Sinorhizobium medicae]MDX0542984.1 amidohydrolase family protein [Sinorhizobium medicae]MDX0858118.1 amidohydrolase family protein [Sinorhizobium medicae]MDX0998364.1 amidohydrolase family protein [Sinorhizobium medicae]MDX1065460.1 amidohydrolase family protein [Sinorhizobium medicae]